MIYQDTLLRPGEDWLEAVKTHLHSADVMIFVGTRDALDATYVQFELEFFYQRNFRRLLPIMFEGDTLAARIPSFMREIVWLIEDESALRDGPSDQVKSRLVEALQDIRLSLPSTPKTRPIRLQPEEKRRSTKENSSSSEEERSARRRS